MIKTVVTLGLPPLNIEFQISVALPTPENPAILAGIVCFIISAVIKGIFWKIK